MSPAGDEKRLEGLARSLGLELPAFRGPFDAFVLADERSRGDPVYLGGNLHAVHPDASGQRLGREQDRSLDNAIISLSDYGHEALEVTAVEGIWCMRLEADLAESARYFALFDSDARIRTWLLVPPARQMIGIGHLWLPSVPPPGALSGRDRTQPGAKPRDPPYS